MTEQPPTDPTGSAPHGQGRTRTAQILRRSAIAVGGVTVAGATLTVALVTGVASGSPISAASVTTLATSSAGTSATSTATPTASPAASTTTAATSTPTATGTPIATVAPKNSTSVAGSNGS